MTGMKRWLANNSENIVGWAIVALTIAGGIAMLHRLLGW